MPGGGNSFGNSRKHGTPAKATISFAKRTKDLELALCQLRECEAGIGLRRLREEALEALRDSRAKDGLAVRHRSDGAQRLVLGGAFELVTARAGTDGSEDGVVSGKTSMSPPGTP